MLYCLNEFLCSLGEQSKNAFYGFMRGMRHFRYFAGYSTWAKCSRGFFIHLFIFKSSTTELIRGMVTTLLRSPQIHI